MVTMAEYQDMSMEDKSNEIMRCVPFLLHLADDFAQAKSNMNQVLEKLYMLEVEANLTNNIQSMVASEPGTKEDLEGRRHLSAENRSSSLDIITHTFMFPEPEVAHPTPTLILRSKIVNKRVCLNVGGVKHEVMWKMLDQFPGSRLGALARAQTHEETLSLASDYCLIQNEYFFDRHPRSFNTILNFYRTGKLHVIEEMCVLALKDDLEYWSISEDLLESCCKNKYDRELEYVMQEMEGECKKMQKEAEEEFGDGILAKYQKYLWDMIEHPDTSPAAHLVSYISMMFVVVSTIGMSLNTMPSLKVMNEDGNVGENPLLALNEAICIAWFTIEYILRLVGCPKKWDFLKNGMNAVDVLAIMPYYVELVMSQQGLKKGADKDEADDEFKGILQVFRVFKLARIFKLARHSTGLQSIVFTLQQSSRELGLLILFIGMAGLVFSSLCYYIEQDADSGYTSIPTSFYWVVITMTTVGYGDIYPVTGLGKLVGTFCAISGALVMSLPIPIIVSNFERYYSEQKKNSKLKARRARLAEARKSEERERLAEWGIVSHPTSPINRKRFIAKEDSSLVELLKKERGAVFFKSPSSILHFPFPSSPSPASTLV